MLGVSYSIFGDMYHHRNLVFNEGINKQSGGKKPAACFAWRPAGCWRYRPSCHLIYLFICRFARRRLRVSPAYGDSALSN